MVKPQADKTVKRCKSSGAGAHQKLFWLTVNKGEYEQVAVRAEQPELQGTITGLVPVEAEDDSHYQHLPYNTCNKYQDGRVGSHRPKVNIPRNQDGLIWGTVLLL